MSEKKKPTELTTDVLLADALLRVTALEQLLIAKGIFTKEELAVVTDGLVEKVTKVVLDKLQNSKDLNDFVDQLSGDKKDLKN